MGGAVISGPNSRINQASGLEFSRSTLLKGPAWRDWKLELPLLRSQAPAWERAET